MPSDFPHAPKLLKGVLVAYESQTPLPRISVLQYNPEQRNRTPVRRVESPKLNNLGDLQGCTA